MFVEEDHGDKPTLRVTFRVTFRVTCIVTFRVAFRLTFPQPQRQAVAKAISDM